MIKHKTVTQYTFSYPVALHIRFYLYPGKSHWWLIVLFPVRVFLVLLSFNSPLNSVLCFVSHIYRSVDFLPVIKAISDLIQSRLLCSFARVITHPFRQMTVGIRDYTPLLPSDGSTIKEASHKG